ncbi:MAG: hydroxymethylglutaryl-CoA lyase, partial [Rickettsiales bacterium]|nr:hydroxymethylglutaryl-CoA lyase [Rickettsiales bacterium]
KVAFIEMLMASGLTRIEAGSFVKPSAVPAMANSAEVAVALKPVQAAHPGVTFSYLVPNIKGLERAMAVGAKEVAIFLAVSEQFSRANINQSVDESFVAILPTVRQALDAGIAVRGYLSTVFGYDDMKFSPEIVAMRTKQLLDMGCYEASLGDTTGIGTPEMVEQLVAALSRSGVALEKVAMHFHDTHGRAIGNIAKAYALGIRSFDAAAGGLGGCPYANSPKGNVRLEDVVAWAATQGIATEVSDATALLRASGFMLAKLGKAA